MDNDFKGVLEEQFSNAYDEGKSGVAKFYTELRIEMDKQLDFFMDLKEEE